MITKAWRRCKFIYKAIGGECEGETVDLGRGGGGAEGAAGGA